jgi:hypothetical protein
VTRASGLSVFVLAVLLTAGSPSTSPGEGSLVAADAAVEQPAAGAQDPVRWDWKGTLGTDRRLVIQNDFGDIRARFGGYTDDVEVHAVIQNLTPGSKELRVEAEATGEGLLIRVAPSQGAPPPEHRPGRSNRADVVAMVPKGARLVARTKEGAIELKGLWSTVLAETDSGDITIRQAGGTANTLNRYGATMVTLCSQPPGTVQAFESLTGDISVVLPPRADFAIRASTSGEITTDVSVEILHHPREEPSKVATAKVGSGASTLTLGSKRGGLRILQRDDPADLAPAPSGPGPQTGPAPPPKP